MALSPKAKVSLQKITPYALIWMIGAIVYIILERGILADTTTYPATDLAYSFENAVIIVIPVSFVGGILMGCIEVLLVKPLFQNFSFGGKILIKALVYVMFMMFVLFMTSFINNSLNLEKNFWEPEVLQAVGIFFKSFAFWSVVIYGIFITVFLQFYSEVSDSLGYVQLKNFFLGTYHKPKEEERIFMFLDIKGSTTMAEQLGHSLYFELLQDFFSDISEPIVKSWGEIYQYVGDEVVISWPLLAGLDNNNCLNCFFESRNVIDNNSAKYLRKYAVIPQFKAGIHLGKVAIGEIGVAKRDILFSGDVLNTTSRIQSKCNEFDVDLLISEELLNNLNLANTNYKPQRLGTVELRGKNMKVDLFSVQKGN